MLERRKQEAPKQGTAPKACPLPKPPGVQEAYDSIDGFRSEQPFNQDSIVRDPEFPDRSRGDVFFWAGHG
jgi:hypothetical protein